jgi:hypothetical protein
MRFGVLLLVAGALVATAPAQLFDFEGEATTGFAGGLTSLTMTQGFVTVTIVRSSGLGFDVQSLIAGPASWGTRTLSPFAHGTTDDFFRVNFSTPVTGVSIQLGDFAADSDRAFLRAFSGLSGGGSLLDSTSLDYGLGSLPVDVGFLAVSGAGIRSIEFGGGSTDFPNSLYWDNLQLRGAVPSPAAALPFALGLLAARRKRRA